MFGEDSFIFVYLDTWNWYCFSVLFFFQMDGNQHLGSVIVMEVTDLKEVQ